MQRRFYACTLYIWMNTPVPSHGYSVRSLVQWLMSRNLDWCKVFESRTVADFSYSGWRPVTVLGVKYLKIRVTRWQPLYETRQSRIFNGHCTRPHWLTNATFKDVTSSGFFSILRIYIGPSDLFFLLSFGKSEKVFNPRVLKATQSFETPPRG